MLQLVQRKLKWFDGNAWVRKAIVYLVLFLMIILLRDILDTRVLLREPSEQVDMSNLDSNNGMSSQPPSTPLDVVWQPVDGTNGSFFVYSAYIDSRMEKVIRIIAATTREIKDDVFCRLWLLDNRTLITRATVKMIREHRLNNKAAFVSCWLPYTITPHEIVGATVAVHTNYTNELLHTNLLVVRDTTPQYNLKVNINVCVRFLNISYNRVDWLIEWLEMNRLLGVDHFYIYNDSSSENVGCVLKHYRKNGLVTILPWTLPSPLKTMWQGGQVAATNDCLYRTMSKASWILPMDLDELVVPRKENTLLTLISSVVASEDIYYSGFIFKNSFFYLKWKDDEEAPSLLWSARKTRRCAQPDPQFYRTKYAVRPMEAFELGVHNINKRVSNSPIKLVPEDRGLLHHYRERRGHTHCATNASVVDRSAHKWSSRLLDAVRLRQTKVAADCPTIVLRKE